MISNSDVIVVDSASKRDVRNVLRVLEMEAYAGVVAAFRAQGSLDEYKELILEHLRGVLNVSWNRHKAEIRKAAYDSALIGLASELNPTGDVTYDWVKESLRVDSAKIQSRPNEGLAEIAENLDYLAAKHNGTLESRPESLFNLLKLPPQTNAPEHVLAILKKHLSPVLCDATSPKKTPNVQPSAAVNPAKQRRKSAAPSTQTIKKEEKETAEPSSAYGLPAVIAINRPTEKINFGRQTGKTVRRRSTADSSAEERSKKRAFYRSAPSSANDGGRETSAAEAEPILGVRSTSPVADCAETPLPPSSSADSSAGRGAYAGLGGSKSPFPSAGSPIKPNIFNVYSNFGPTPRVAPEFVRSIANLNACNQKVIVLPSANMRRKFAFQDSSSVPIPVEGVESAPTNLDQPETVGEHGFAPVKPSSYNTKGAGSELIVVRRTTPLQTSVSETFPPSGAGAYERDRSISE